jgi:RNA polymerase sigma-70 factor (ECF subfamily)
MKHPTTPPISLQKLRSGDRSEFGRMVEVYSSPIYRLALNMLGSEQDAEDVLQETFIKAFKGIQGFKEQSNLSTWIYRIAINEALMILRKARRIAGSLDDSDETDDDVEPREVVDWCCLPEESFLREEVRNELDAAIKLLPEKLRIVFILRDMEDMSIRDTASTLGITEMAVKTRLLRARLQLRENLTRYFREQKPVNHE